MDILDEYANAEEYKDYPYLMRGGDWHWNRNDFLNAEEDNFQHSICNDPEPVANYTIEHGQYALDGYVKVYYRNGHLVERPFIPMFFEVAPVCFEYANRRDCWEWIDDDECMDDLEDGPNPDDPGYHLLTTDRIDFSDYEFADDYWRSTLSMVECQSF